MLKLQPVVGRQTFYIYSLSFQFQNSTTAFIWQNLHMVGIKVCVDRISPETDKCKMQARLEKLKLLYGFLIPTILEILQLGMQCRG